MNIDSIISETQSVASQFGLRLRIIDITDNIVDLRLYIDVELFIQIYANQLKDKLNLNLIFKNKRLCGYDSEGGRTAQSKKPVIYQRGDRRGRRV